MSKIISTAAAYFIIIFPLRGLPLGDGFDRGLRFDVQEAGGNVAEAFDVSVEILRIVFDQLGVSKPAPCSCDII